MAYENASKSKSSSVQKTVDKAIKKSSDTKAAKGAVATARTKRTTHADALAKAYSQGVMDAIYAAQIQQQAPPPGVGPGAPEMPFTQGAPPPPDVGDMGVPPGPPMGGPGAGPTMVPPPPDMMGGGPPPGPMTLPPGLAPAEGIAPGTPGGLSPNALFRSRLPRM